MMTAASKLPLPTARLLTERQAAAYFGVSVGTFRSHITVDPVRIGGCKRYDIRALDKWADSHGQFQPATADDWLERLDEGESARN